jgi:Uma2 family endonuclease
MIATPQPPNMTIAEYLAWEPLQEVRYEYVYGIAIAMTGGTIPHNDIALNLYRALYVCPLPLQSQSARICPD